MTPNYLKWWIDKIEEGLKDLTTKGYGEIRIVVQDHKVHVMHKSETIKPK